MFRADYVPIVAPPFDSEPSIPFVGLPWKTRLFTNNRGIRLDDELCGAPDTLKRIAIDMTIKHKTRNSPGILTALGEAGVVATFDVAVLNPGDSYFVYKGSVSQALGPAFGIEANNNGLITYRFGMPVQRSGSPLHLGALAKGFMFSAAYGDNLLNPSPEQLERSGLDMVPEAVDKIRNQRYMSYIDGDDGWGWPEATPPDRPAGISPPPRWCPRRCPGPPAGHAAPPPPAPPRRLTRPRPAARQALPTRP